MFSRKAFCHGLVVALALAGAAGGAWAEGRTPLPTITKGKGDQCVEPTAVMRTDHMRFLLHQRDETVHGGIRTKRHSLKECIECHAARDATGKPMPVTAEGQFCQSCHSFAAVHLDCFSCHATTPDK
jgi:predicted CXXCH cytochrome family protein